MKNRSFKCRLNSGCLLLVLLLAIIVWPNAGWSYNWSWDQGHDNVIVDPGDDDDGCDPPCNDDDPCSPGQSCNVYAASGSYQEIFTDLEFDGIGPTLSVMRSYNGNDISSGYFGYRWSLTFGKQIVRGVDNETGREFIIVKLPTGQRSTFYEQADGDYLVENGPGSRYSLDRNSDGTYIISDHNGNVNLYSSDGHHTAIVDRNGNRVDIEYDNDGCPSGATDASGRSISITFGPNGKIAAVEDFAGRRVEYTYNSSGDLTAVADPLGHTTNYTYDSEHRLVDVIDPLGNTIQHLTYDSNGKVSSFLEDGVTYYMSYSDGFTSKTDPSGNSWTSYYDDTGLVYKVIDPSGLTIERGFNYIAGGSTDFESYGCSGGENVAKSSNVSVSASSYYSSSYLPAYAVDGNPSTTWVSSYYSNQHSLTLTFVNPVDVDRIVLGDDGYGYWGLYFSSLNSASLTFSNGYTQSVSLPSGNTYANVEINVPVQEDVEWMRLDVTLNYNDYIWIPEFKVYEAPHDCPVYAYTWDSRGNRTSVTDPLGNTTAYTYTDDNELETVTDPMGVVTRYEYDANGNMIRKYMAYGTDEQIVETYAYNASGNMVSKTNAEGSTWTFTYDQYGNALSQTDPLGSTTTNSYDQFGNLITETDPLGNTTTYQYDLMGRLTQVTDPLGNVTTTTYDANGNKISQAGANGEVWTWQYDSYGQLLTIADPLGNQFSRTYDALGRIGSQTSYDNQLMYFEYDNAGRVTQELTKAFGSSTSVEMGDLVGLYTYDNRGNLITRTEPGGRTIRYAYDMLDRTSEQVVEGDTTKYAYNPAGLLDSIVFSDGSLLNLQYDSHGRVVSVSDASGVVRKAVYNQNGKLIELEDGIGSVQSFTYDFRGKLLTSNGKFELTNEYDATGRLTETRRNGTVVQSIQYDAEGRPVTFMNGIGATVHISYDASGNVLQYEDPYGQFTSFEYDALDRKTRETYPDGTYSTWHYGEGLLQHTVSPSGDTTKYTYDNFSRVIQIDYPGANDDHFAYQESGLLDSAWNSHTMVELSYNSLGQLTGETINGLTVSASYDPESRTKTIIYPSGKTVEEIYDERGQLIDIIVDGVQLAHYEWDQGSRILSRSIRNGVLNSAYTYDNAGHISGLTHSNSSGVLFDLQYGFDVLGRRIYSRDLSQDQKSGTYDFDNAQRLVKVKTGQIDASGFINSPTEEITYLLDSLGNWRSRTSISDGSSVRSINAMNQYTDVDGVAFSYDQSGNLIDDGEQLYEWNSQNQLEAVIRASDSSLVCQFLYDPFGRRVAAIRDGDTVSYAYSENRVVEEWSAGSAQRSYVYGPGVKDPIALYTTGDVYYYLCDILGSVLMLTDETGQVQESVEYDVYGAAALRDANGAAIDCSTVYNSLLFTGHWFDCDIGLYYMVNRYYDPSLGRFISRDPTGYADGLNLYLYVQGDPVSMIDPLGLKSYGFGGDCQKVSPIKLDLKKLLKFIPQNILRRMGMPGLSFGVDIEKCRVCCETGPHRGTWVTDTGVEVSVDINWAPPIPSIPFMVGPVPMYVKFEIMIGISGSLSASTDRCNDSATGGGCIQGKIGIDVSVAVGIDDVLSAGIKGGGSGGPKVCLEKSVAGICVKTELCAEVHIVGFAQLLFWTYEITIWGWSDCMPGPSHCW